MNEITSFHGKVTFDVRCSTNFIKPICHIDFLRVVHASSSQNVEGAPQKLLYKNGNEIRKNLAIKTNLTQGTFTPLAKKHYREHSITAPSTIYHTEGAVERTQREHTFTPEVGFSPEPETEYGAAARWHGSLGAGRYRAAANRKARRGKPISGSLRVGFEAI